MQTIIRWHPCATYFVVFKISPRRDQNWSAFQIQKKSATSLNGRNPTTLSFQNLNILKNLKIQSGDLLWLIIIVISFPHVHKSAACDYELRDSE